MTTMPFLPGREKVENLLVKDCFVEAFFQRSIHSRRAVVFLVRFFEMYEAALSDLALAQYSALEVGPSKAVQIDYDPTFWMS